MEDISARQVSLILEALGIGVLSEADSQQWLDDVAEQLEDLKSQRLLAHDEDNEDALEADVKYFETLSHFVWWTLACVTRFGHDQFGLASKAMIPAQSKFDDFLCLMRTQHFDEQSEEVALSLSSLLDEYASHDVVITIMPHDMEEFTEECRQGMRQHMQHMVNAPAPAATDDSDVIAEQLELGCCLYACMLASVDSKEDDFALHRWRTCYETKCVQVFSWLRRQRDDANKMFQRVKAMPHCYGKLIAFTRRSDLLPCTELLERLEQAALKDKKVFDAENDHSGKTSDFQCPNCHSFNTESFLIQMRSADEPMTQFWKCHACNKNGREN